jgi:hypothetical protein
MSTRARAKTKKLPTSAKRKEKITDIVRWMNFPQVKGKKLEDVEFSTCAEDHSIHLLFHDKTALTFSLEPGFTLFTDYADWKTGDCRPIRNWRPVRSRLFRE